MLYLFYFLATTITSSTSTTTTRRPHAIINTNTTRSTNSQATQTHQNGDGSSSSTLGSQTHLEPPVIPVCLLNVVLLTNCYDSCTEREPQHRQQMVATTNTTITVDKRQSRRRQPDNNNVTMTFRLDDKGFHRGAEGKGRRRETTVGARDAPGTFLFDCTNYFLQINQGPTRLTPPLATAAGTCMWLEMQSSCRYVSSPPRYVF